MSLERVAFISYHACPLAAPGQGKSGGMNVYVRQLARAMGNLGIKVDIFTRQHVDSAREIEAMPRQIPGGIAQGITGEMPEELSEDVRVIHLPAGHADAPFEDLFQHLPEFLAGVREYQRRNNLTYQAIHSHYWLSGWAGQALAQELGVPHVITFHTLALIKMQSRAGEVEPLRRQQVERQLIAAADSIVAFSPHERDAMVRLYGADAGRITLVPCGVDLSMFRPLDQEESRKRLGLNGDKVLLYVGRIESLKGLELLLHTAAYLETCEPVRVLVVGADTSEGQEVNHLRRLARALNVEEVFDFVGRVAQDELPWYYSAADVCVVPSYYESFGLAALESMACGTPVVASRVGGLSTVIQHGRTGYLKSWRCPEAFANSLEMIISSKGLQRSMGLAARRRAEDMGWDQVAARIALTYDSAGHPDWP